MIYISIVILLASFIIYMSLAKRFNIVDIPNSRSSHKEPIIRGGGIIFYLASFLFFVLFEQQYIYYFLGLTFIAIISFLDDLYSLGTKVRFLIQLVAIALTMWEIHLFDSPFYLVIPVIILSVGYLNIYNFMDGINGITGIYSLSILIAILHVNKYYVPNFVDINLIYLMIISIMIFAFFNFRKKAKVFAGDVGSITIGLTVIFLLAKVIYETQNGIYALFGIVYAIDGGLTLIERLVIRNENIFKPHRRHLYQIMVDSKKFGHITTSIIYGILQLAICALVIVMGQRLSNQYQLLFFGLLLLSLTIIYIAVKRSLICKNRSSIQV